MPAVSQRGSVHDYTERLRHLSPDDILAWLNRGKYLIAAAVLACVAAAFIYAQTATPRYTVYTDLVVDPSNLQVVDDDVFANTQQRDTQLLEVESKLRILTSRNVLERVIDRMNLAEDPEFFRPGWLDPIKQLFSGKSADGDRKLAVLRALSERVEASREERSYVVVLSVWTEDPFKSVELSNAIVDAFETELFEAASGSAGRVVSSISERLDELRANVTEAEARVEAFKRQNGLQSNGEQLVSARRSSELDDQVLQAQERQIQLGTRYRELERALNERSSATLPAFQSNALVSLRAQYNQLQQQLQALSLTYLDRHPRLQAIRTEIASVERAMVAEAQRIVNAAKLDADQAQSVVQELRQRAQAEENAVFEDNSSMVRLRELERDARAKAALYETFLSRSQEITERQQIDTSNIRVISRAVPPISRSWPPRTLILLAAGAFAGLFIGVGLALALGLLRYLREPQARAA
ncbi:GumC family protein [Chelativorans sp. AA-79]|uniref:GumC family protein n=1 Tax=Chelativorans sp. AA-79 TaxID=3028735 RepID=UPI0023F66013|nr:GumC family protein [Chelativorans sp. AA-79]WEX10626.1 GumC family protein [Chelativorans sp. AA-79]